MIQNRLAQIDVEKGGVDLAAGEAKISGVRLDAHAAQAGHRCLLVISRSRRTRPRERLRNACRRLGRTVTNDSDVAQLTSR